MRPNFNNFQIDLSKFKKIDDIGRGQFGIVQLVENIDNGRQYALKIMKHVDKKYVNREINVMIRLDHPSIIKFYGFSISVDGKVSILMQHAKNGSLRDILNDTNGKRSSLGYDNTAKQKILIGVARGMIHLHQKNIIHRDIKPDNILIDGNFNPLITDFGFSRNSDDIGKTKNVGSPIYEAPESFARNDYNLEVDVYSFGIMMYEIVTDLLPYKDILNNITSVFQFKSMVDVNNTRPTFPPNHKIPPDLVNLIKECWAKEPSDRPTFEQIFNKLAYDTDDPSNFENLFKEEKDYKYYLPGVKQDEILNFVDDLIERENTAQYSIKQSIEQMKQQISSIKQDSELAINQMKTEINELKNELMNQLKSMNKGSDLENKQNQYKIQTIEYQKGNDFEGILKYLTRKTGSNIHDNEMIQITTNSKHKDDIHYFIKDPNFYHPKNIVDFDKNNEYRSNDAGGAIVCFDFKDKLVQVKQYEIQTCMKDKSTSHLRNWVIEVSKDGINWTIIDRRKNDDTLKEPKSMNIFEVSKPINEFCRFVRLRQTGTSWYTNGNCCIISICKIDFFGEIGESQA
ncbi:hypothetical protein M9Y10_031862 [Tritrichomonas musculus]|uniref:mitogen-activated protein kinase kinase n=1 Tax=Tritrichomonas musculus TaxID=1915356 RepID=A0ABR2GZZ5_9EUKA